MATKATKKVSSKKVVKASEAIEQVAPIAEPVAVTRAKAKLSPKVLSMALFVVGIALLTYKVGPYFVPAIVDNMPISRFAVWHRLEQSYGEQVYDDLVNEKVLDQAIKQSGIKVEMAKVEEQMKTLEEQFKDLGGLEEALKQRGLSRKDLEKQIKTQLAVEEVLKDKITPSEDELKTQFDSGAKTVYKDKKFEEVKDAITEELKQSKLRDSFLAWFEEVKKNSKIKRFGL